MLPQERQQGLGIGGQKMATEKRLIDADKLLSEIHHYDKVQKSDVWLTEDIEYLLKEQPTVDAVEVVRCKDCKHDNMTTCPLCWIENHTLHFINHDPEFFCGNGERREGE
jgi:predicted hydrocarbon binding protein